MNTKVKINIWKAKDGWRWNITRKGRIIAESGEGYARKGTMYRTLNRLLTALSERKFEFVLPEQRQSTARHR